MSRRVILAALLSAAAGVVPVAAADESLTVITTQTIDLSTGKASVDLSDDRSRYNGIRVRAKRGAVDLTCVQVIYRAGGVHNEERTIHLLNGERSAPIDLREGRRDVQRINLLNKPQKGSVEIEIIGVEQTGKISKAPGKPMRRGACDKAGGESVATKPATKPTEPDKKQDIVTTPTVGKQTPGAPGKELPGGEVLFGSQTVGFGIDKDVIRVGSEVGKFDRIRLRVLDNDIHLNEVKVVYSNGDPDVLGVNADIKQNSKTNWLKLNGDRFIKEIQLSYRSKPSFKGLARVEVLGEYADNWLGPNGEGSKYNQGWVLLGAQAAGFVGFDNDVVPVGRNQGGFKKVRITVRDRAITLNELRIIYASGSEDIIPVKARVDAGTTWGPADLKGGTRAIKEIRAKYRSRFFDKNAKGKGGAIVEVWGRH
jgi:hypothetical protein